MRDHSPVTPLSALEFAAAIQAARRKLPGVDIAITDLGDDTAWTVDCCCRAIRLGLGLPREDLAAALTAAAARLAEAEKELDWCPGMLPIPRDQQHRNHRAG